MDPSKMFEESDSMTKEDLEVVPGFLQQTESVIDDNDSDEEESGRSQRRSSRKLKHQKKFKCKNRCS